VLGRLNVRDLLASHFSGPSAVPPSAVPPSAVPPSAVPPSAVPPSAVPPSAVPPSAVPPSAVPPSAVPPSAPLSAPRSPRRSTTRSWRMCAVSSERARLQWTTPPFLLTHSLSPCALFTLDPPPHQTLYNAQLENACSEQGARMSAMDNSSRNASDMLGRLTLSYNRSRQATITTELIEIVAALES
ncbi:unnamed protein product, partial [Closterium sp. NIES-54]